MTFEKSLMRELALASLAASGILLAVFATQQFIRLLGKAAGGSVDPEAVTAFLAFTAMNGLPSVLTVSMFFAVLMVLTRSYRDSEMTVWFASGLSLAGWVRPVLVFALPVVTLIAATSLVVAPWSQTQLEEYKRQLESRDDVSRVRPGVFTEAKADERVFFVDSLTDSADAVNNVFLQMVHNGRLGIVVANRAFVETKPNGDKFVVFVDGRRYEGEPGTLEYRVIDFKRFDYRLEQKVVARANTGTSSMPVSELLVNPNPDKTAELHYRLSLPVMAVVLVLLAIPLSFVNPRAGRSFNFAFAILVFAIYYNSMILMQKWIEQGKIAPHLGFWPVHGFMFVLMLLLFWRRLAPLRWFAFAR